MGAKYITPSNCFNHENKLLLHYFNLFLVLISPDEINNTLWYWGGFRVLGFMYLGLMKSGRWLRLHNRPTATHRVRHLDRIDFWKTVLLYCIWKNCNVENSIDEAVMAVLHLVDKILTNVVLWLQMGQHYKIIFINIEFAREMVDCITKRFVSTG